MTLLVFNVEQTGFAQGTDAQTGLAKLAARCFGPVRITLKRMHNPVKDKPVEWIRYEVKLVVEGQLPASAIERFQRELKNMNMDIISAACVPCKCMDGDS